MGLEVFELLEGVKKGQPLKTVAANSDFVKSFYSVSSTNFQLECGFSITLASSETSYNVVLKEKLLWKEVYVNPRLFEALGKEACLVLDVALSMGGSEAIAETYYSVMNTQRFDGGQSNETLEMRTLVDWCLPPVLSCPESISKIAKLYRLGDGNKLKKHRAPILQDKRGRSSNKYKVSKVLDKQVFAEKRIPFFK